MHVCRLVRLLDDGDRSRKFLHELGYLLFLTGERVQLDVEALANAFHFIDLPKQAVEYIEPRLPGILEAGLIFPPQFERAALTIARTFAADVEDAPATLKRGQGVDDIGRLLRPALLRLENPRLNGGGEGVERTDQLGIQGTERIHSVGKLAQQHFAFVFSARHRRYRHEQVEILCVPTLSLLKGRKPVK